MSIGYVANIGTLIMSGVLMLGPRTEPHYILIGAVGYILATYMLTYFHQDEHP